YTESILFTQNDTTIIGQQGSGGQQAVILTRTNSNIVDFGATSRCVITNCNIQLTAAASAIYAIKIGASGSGKIRFCRTETICTTGGILAGVGYSAGGELVFAYGKVFQTNNVDGDGSETKAVFRISNGSTLNLLDLKELDVNTDGSSDHSVIASDEGTSGTILMEGCREANINDDDADCTVLLLLTGSSSSHRFRYNEARVNKSITNPGDGIGICLPSGSCKIHTAFNHIRVGQTTGTAYSFKLASGTELVSHFDDLVAVDGSNIASGATYNFVNAPSDGDIQISGSYLNMYAQTKTVGSRGGDYTSIQDAIDSITDAASDYRYGILIYPGTYTENVDLTGKPYIDLIGLAAKTNTLINSSSGVSLTLCTESIYIQNLKITSTGGSVLEVPSGASEKQYVFENCSLRQVISNTYADAIEIKSGIVTFFNCSLHYIQTGTGGGTHRMINITGAASVYLKISGIVMDIAIVSDDVVGVTESNNVIEFALNKTKLIINRSGIVTGETIGVLINGSYDSQRCSSSRIQIENDGSGGTATAMKTSGNVSVVTSISTIYKVTGFTTNNSFNIAATDHIHSDFDYIEAADYNTGAGDLYAIHAHNNGDFHVARDISLERNIEVGGTLALASGTTVNNIDISISSPGSDDSLITEKALVDWTNGLAALYVKKDGSTPFTNPVAGVTPTLGSHLATKDYADGIAGGGGVNDLGPFVTKELCDPPVSATVDDKYIVCSDSTASASGVWIGHENDVATAVDSTAATTWTFETPVAGKHGWVTDEGIDYTFNGTSWVATGTLIDHTTIQNIGSNTHALIDSHIANNTTNPHAVTKTNVGLGNVTDDAQ
ncbi:MAG: DUF2793 domain-containing protein, partial [Bacteroidetes bacterium]|nr:DUF2793 domain-containing protein [Bacteroidota bacterium]